MRMCVLSSFHSDSWRKGTPHIFRNFLNIILPSSSSNERLSACEPSDTHVYDALVCDQKWTLEPWSHVLHLHLLQVTLPGVLDRPGGGLSAAGLPQAGAATCGVNARVSAATAVLTAVSATRDMKQREPLVIYADK